MKFDFSPITMIQPFVILYTSLVLALGSCTPKQTPETVQRPTAETITPTPAPEENPLLTGAEQTELYLKHLQGKRVALVVNQTSIVDKTHLVDTLLSHGVQIVTIFAPEHGFRGEADAGAYVKDAKDTKTGLPIVS